MSKLKDFMRIVNERDRLRIENESLQRDLKARKERFYDILEYGKSTDEQFWLNYRFWSDQKTLNQKTWDHKKLLNTQDFADVVNGQMLNAKRKFEFESNVPKLELEGESLVDILNRQDEEEPMPAVCPECGAAPMPGFNGTHYEDCSQLGVCNCMLRREKGRDA